MTLMTAKIVIQRSKLYPCVARPGPAWRWYYECVGPDGTRFNNMSIRSLRDVLKRHYGRDVEIVELWKTESTPPTA